MIEELIARALYQRISDSLSQLSTSIDGAGVHWHVDIQTEDGERSCRIHCFNYDAALPSLTLGLRGNTHLSKLRIATPPKHRVGAEYLIYFHSAGKPRAIGRTQEITFVQDAVGGWVADRMDLSALHKRCFFVDERWRAMKDISARVTPVLKALGSQTELVIEGSPEVSEFNELWVYAGKRSCRLTEGARKSINLELLLERTSLACLDNIDEQIAGEVVKHWIDSKGTLGGVNQISSGLELFPFALEFEAGNHSVWHWGNVMLQAEHSDVLSFYRPVLERILKSTFAARFFSFTSLSSLFFSRSALYPFDTDGMPCLYPADEPSGEKPFAIKFMPSDRSLENNAQPETFTAQQAFDFIEKILSREPISPYFGDLESRAMNEVNDELKAVESELRAQLIQKQQWAKLVVYGKNGQFCELQSRARQRIVSTLFSSSDSELEIRSSLESSPRQIATLLQEWLN